MHLQAPAEAAAEGERARGDAGKPAAARRLLQRLAAAAEEAAAAEAQVGVSTRLSGKVLKTFDRRVGPSAPQLGTCR